MSLLLSIDTAGSACAVALSTAQELLSVQILREPRVHSARLVPLISEVVEEVGCRMDDIRAVAVSKGPGSYTGLRIGVSTAKGLAFGLGIPLVGVATFEALAWANRALPTAHCAPRTAHLLTAAPSRRYETYWQAWRVDGGVPVAVTEPDSDAYKDVAGKLGETSSPVTIVGEGAEALKVPLEDAGLDVVVLEIEAMRPAIHGVSELGQRLLADGKTEDVASFEPFYLMEFVARKGGSPFDRLPF